MDAFEEMMKKKRRRRRIGILLLCAVIPVLLALGAYAFVFHINQFQTELTMNGPEEITLEFGEPYEDPGAQAWFSGTILMKEGRELRVAVEGKVDPRTVGTYTVRYSAGYEKWEDSATRTVHVVDTKQPRIILKSSPGSYVIPGQEYQEEGFVARDNYDGDLSDQVVRTQMGNKVTYYVEDSSGNSTQVSRDILYYDPLAPELTLQGDAEITLTAGEKFKDPGYTAWDNCDGDLTDRVQVSGSVNTYRAGTYQLTYTVTDCYGNTATATRTVKVKAKPQPSTVTPSGKVVYLTFDDGPCQYTRDLLAVLKKYNVKATFFVVDTGYPEILKEIAADGHSIGIHSATHSYKTIYASEEAFFDDLYKMQSIIKDATGITTTLMRFPGGSSNKVSSFNPGIMTRLTQAVGDMGFQYFDWNVSSGDAGETKSTEQVFKNVIAGIQKHNVSIVLQHDIKKYSVDAVEKIIVWGLENGYTFLALDSSSPTAHHGVNN